MSANQHRPEPREHFARGRDGAVLADYIRIAVLGDSASCGVGDPTPHGWRGWAQILADAIAVEHHVSLCKLAVPGATVADVRREQLTPAIAHRPAVASLIVGLNDVLRSRWDPARIQEDLLHIAGALTRQGTLLITVRYHDHTRVLGLPALLARPLRRRIEELNEIYDDVHEQYGTLRLDLDSEPSVYSRAMWSFDSLHPSERGHRWLARLIAAQLIAEGLHFPLPSRTCTGAPPTRRERFRITITDIVPWFARRLRELAVAPLACRVSR